MHVHDHASISRATEGRLGGCAWSVRGKDLQSRGFASCRAATRVDAVPSKDLKHFGVEEVDAIRLRLGKGKREIVKGVSF